MDDNFVQTITPTIHDLGDFKVRRAFPGRPRTMVGPFIFVDQFGPADLDIGPRQIWWNFVYSDRDRIEHAKEQWRADAFPVVPGDAEERIPLPDVPKTVSYP